MRALKERAGSTALGRGKMFMRAWPFLSMRLAGMRLPGNEVRLRGSAMRMRAPFWSRDSEKSPARSRAVGKVRRWRELGYLRGRNSCDQKKKSFSRFLLKDPMV